MTSKGDKAMNNKLRLILDELNHDLDMTTRYDCGPERQRIIAITSAITAYLTAK